MISGMIPKNASSSSYAEMHSAAGSAASRSGKKLRMCRKMSRVPVEEEYSLLSSWKEEVPLGAAQQRVRVPLQRVPPRLELCPAHVQHDQPVLPALLLLRRNRPSARRPPASSRWPPRGANGSHAATPAAILDLELNRGLVRGGFTWRSGTDRASEPAALWSNGPSSSWRPGRFYAPERLRKTKQTNLRDQPVSPGSGRLDPRLQKVKLRNKLHLDRTEVSRETRHAEEKKKKKKKKKKKIHLDVDVSIDVGGRGSVIRLIEQRGNTSTR
ncbi:hypothetical protein GBF38_001160 [Nibea albiflora]|uniref:Uncharacterized protein n=1 Tax=Nibea albiflora TaxID=240163 RepID=A0ACB7ETP6_NIBAL|nr:hypothetical protein GBF38_001160 [Nibea albiflora]